MKALLACALASAILMPRTAIAQTEVAVTPFVLMSLQPSDDTYVGGPYLNEGLGGMAPGFGAGLHIVAANGLIVGAELTTARFEREQYGRLIGGGYETEGIPHTTRLHDTLLSALIGYSGGTGATRWQVLGGAARLLDAPTVNGIERERGEGSNADVFPVVLTGGVDLLHALNVRASLQIGARYALADRPENFQYLGIGRHLLRIAAGLRLRLN